MAQSFKCSFKTDNKPIFIVDSVTQRHKRQVWEGQNWWITWFLRFHPCPQLYIYLLIPGLTQIFYSLFLKYLHNFFTWIKCRSFKLDTTKIKFRFITKMILYPRSPIPACSRNILKITQICNLNTLFHSNLQLGH